MMPADSLTKHLSAAVQAVHYNYLGLHPPAPSPSSLSRSEWLHAAITPCGHSCRKMQRCEHLVRCGHLGHIRLGLHVRRLAAGVAEGRVKVAFVSLSPQPRNVHAVRPGVRARG